MSDKKPFICPRCKEISGFDECAPTRGWQNLYYDEFGENIGGDNRLIQAVAVIGIIGILLLYLFKEV